MSEENKNVNETPAPEENKQGNNGGNLNAEGGRGGERNRGRFPNGGNRPAGGNSPKGSFNFYWLYAIVVILLLGLVYFDMIGLNPRSYQIEQGDLKNTILAKGYAKQILVVNEKVAEITIDTKRAADRKSVV